MAVITLIKFAVASGALYLSKELGVWDFPEDNKKDINNFNINDLTIKAKRIFFDKEDKKPPPDCEPSWSKELKLALGGTLKSIQQIPGHWRKFGQILQDNIKSLFKNDDD